MTKDTELIYSSETHVLRCWISEYTQRFCIEFNGELHTYKTKAGFTTKKRYLIEKYNLKKEA